MDATHWMTAITHALQLGTQTLSQSARPLADLVMPWVHDVSIALLAAAVVTLGCVMLLELRALAALRRGVDAHLGRVFEQLDLIRFDHVQLLEAHARIAAAMAAATSVPAERVVTATSGPTSTTTSAALAPPTIAAGEARLLASLAEARARRAAAQRADAPPLSAATR